MPAKNPDPAPATPAYDLPVWFKSMFHAFLLTLALTGVAARPPPKRCLTSLFGAQPSEAIYATDGPAGERFGPMERQRTVLTLEALSVGAGGTTSPCLILECSVHACTLVQHSIELRDIQCCLLATCQTTTPATNLRWTNFSRCKPATSASPSMLVGPVLRSPAIPTYLRRRWTTARRPAAPWWWTNPAPT